MDCDNCAWKRISLDVDHFIVENRKAVISVYITHGISCTHHIVEIDLTKCRDCPKDGPED